MGVISAIIGMSFAVNGELQYAILCLAISGICDMYDGKVARKYNKNEKDNEYGVQIDSFADVVNFGVFPVVILMSLGLNEWYHFVIYAIYTLCAISRLAHFNIIVSQDGPIKTFTGLPTTSAAIIFPFFWLIDYIFKLNLLNIIFPVVMLIMAILFIADVKIIRKPSKTTRLIFSIAALALLIYIFI